MSDPEIPEAAVRAAAEKLREHYDSEFDATHMAWQDFAPQAREVLAAAWPHLLKPAQDATRRLSAGLIASHARLAEPFTDRPELSPWSLSIHPRIVALRAALGLESHVVELREDGDHA